MSSGDPSFRNDITPGNKFETIGSVLDGMRGHLFTCKFTKMKKKSDINQVHPLAA